MTWIFVAQTLKSHTQSQRYGNFKASRNLGFWSCDWRKFVAFGIKSLKPSTLTNNNSYWIQYQRAFKKCCVWFSGDWIYISLKQEMAHEQKTTQCDTWCLQTFPFLSLSLSHIFTLCRTVTWSAASIGRPWPLIGADIKFQCSAWRREISHSREH